MGVVGDRLQLRPQLVRQRTHRIAESPTDEAGYEPDVGDADSDEGHDSANPSSIGRASFDGQQHRRQGDGRSLRQQRQAERHHTEGQQSAAASPDTPAEVGPQRGQHTDRGEGLRSTADIIDDFAVDRMQGEQQ